jgi:DNA end-binding protein Ku
VTGGIEMASVWKGHITFGLVSFPVRLQAAARSQAVSFNQLHQCDHSRVRQVLYCQAEDKPVSRSELVKGFEYEKDRYVVVEERELDQIAPRSSRVSARCWPPTPRKSSRRWIQS